ncbi:MAG: hypothetical protein LBH42_10090 [Treponema sp.]|jgi:hypothetical protein|nr:hypothetical protein [Treponema sp.]
MYDYGNSGNSWGIIIGILIAVLVVFLITREFWCWYWKVNKLVALLEEQNNLLKKQFGISSGILSPDVSMYNMNSSDPSTIELIDKEVIQNTDMKTGAGHGNTILQLTQGTIIKEKETFRKWSRIVIKDGKEGWCLTECLK